MMKTLNSRNQNLANLKSRVRDCAKSCLEEFGMNIDTEVYKKFEKDPLEPLLFGGTLESPWCFFGRDPGKDEIRLQEPLIGAGGTLVREGAYQRLYGKKSPDLSARLGLSQKLLFCNGVPYKPFGNKSWSRKIKKRFHPLITELLVDFWEGHEVITLGNEAFDWFSFPLESNAADKMSHFWQNPDRYTKSISTILTSPQTGKTKELTLHPLPHPSPLNATWYKKFPELLTNTLGQLSI